MSNCLSPSDLGLPHRAPFLFLESVSDLQPGRSARATQVFAASNPIFLGHFPGEPVVPGVLLAEGIAQLGGIIAASSLGNKRFYLAAIRQMKFPTPAFPDEEICFEATLASGMDPLILAEGTARVGERIVAVGAVILAAKVHNPQPPQ